MALILYRPAFWILLGIQILLFIWLARRVRLRWWPAWLLRVGMIALIFLVIYSPKGKLFSPTSVPPRQVMVVDYSESIDINDLLQVEADVRAWQADEPNRLLVVFGDQAEIVFSPEDDWPEVDRRASNLSAALNLAVELLGNIPGEVILLTDGIAASPMDVSTSIARLASQGHQLNFVPLPAATYLKDNYAGELWAPSNLWELTPFTTVLPVYMQEAGEITVQLEVDGEPIEEHVAQLQVGVNYVPFAVQAQDEGIMTLAANVVSEDGRVGNNGTFTTVRIFPSPRILFVTLTPDAAVSFIGALIESGMQVDTISPDEFPPNVSLLEDYQVIFIHDLLSQHLSKHQMLVLREFVYKHGQGVVFLGGVNSYTLGGYKRTVIEPMLPVKLEPPQRSERTPVTFVLVLDRSGSMQGLRAPIQPIELAREAGMRMVENLNAEDFLGVLTYNMQATWDVPISVVGNGLSLRNAQDAINRVQANGGTFTYAAMEAVLLEMDVTPTSETRHVLLLSDGQSSDGSREKFQALAKTFKQDGITISTIALGTKADQKTLSLIAEEGGGRYYQVLDAAALPRTMVVAMQASISENVQDGQTNLFANDIHPILSSMSVSSLPEIRAYNALQSKSEEGAEDILLSGNFQDPLLSVWQYGLGRVAAWMTDIGEAWAPSWATWSDKEMFWAQVVQYVIPNPALGPAQVTVLVHDTGVSIQAQIRDSAGLPINLAKPIFSYADAETSQLHRFTLAQTGPGLYALDIPRPSEGAYRAVISYQADDEQIDLATSLVVNYPLEWKPASAHIAMANLTTWAEATGGGQVSLAEAPDHQQVAESTLDMLDQETLWWRVLLALILLWPVEIALRRQWLPWK